MTFEGTYKHIFSLRERILKHTKPEGKQQRLPLDADSILVVIVEVGFGSGLHLDDSSYWMNPTAPFATLTSYIRTNLGVSEDQKLFFTVDRDFVCGSALMSTLARDPDGGLYVVVSNRMPGDQHIFQGEGRLLPGVAWVEGEDDSRDPDYETQPDWLAMLTTDTADLHLIDKQAIRQKKREYDQKRKAAEKAKAQADLRAENSTSEDLDFANPATTMGQLPALIRQNANEGILSAGYSEHREDLQKITQLGEHVCKDIDGDQAEAKAHAQLGAKNSIAKDIDFGTPARAIRPVPALMRQNANEGFLSPGYSKYRDRNFNDSHIEDVAEITNMASQDEDGTNDDNQFSPGINGQDARTPHIIPDKPSRV